MWDIKCSPDERARWNAFFTLDQMKGGAVTARYKQVREAYRKGTSLADTKKRVAALITHAVGSTAFYKDYDPGAPLEKFPVVTKDTFRENYEAFQSVAYRGAPDNRKMTTSGSTGTPFTMIQDVNKVTCNTADSIFMGTLGHYYIGQKQAFIRVWVNNVKKSRMRLMMENSLMIDSSSLSHEALGTIARTIRTKKVRCLVGYASALGELSRYLDESGTDLSRFVVGSVIPISENMPAGVRKRLSEQFQCPVRSWYSNEENGIMGVQDRDDSEAYYINSESYYYEILKMDSDEPAPDGEPGRIVITDLTNRAFPVIRYDNGDTAVARHEYYRQDGTRIAGSEPTDEAVTYKLYLTELYGRRSDLIYDTRGRAVTPYLITNNLWDVKGVRQFRFIQHDAGRYELRLNGDPEKMAVTEMIGRIRPTLGNDAIIEVTFVDEIPVLASGKRKYIENLWEGRPGEGDRKEV